MKIKVDGKEYEVDIEEVDGKIKIKYDGEEHLVEINEECEKKEEKKVEFCGRIIKAPMPGTINSIFIKEGNFVEKGSVLLSLIAMKMENKIIADSSGIIKEIKVKENDTVESGQILLTIE